jgi:membrane protease YdiL (CAAX protease family)
MDTSEQEERGTSLPVRIAAGWAVIFVALAFAGWFGQFGESHWGIAGKLRYGIQALIMAGITVPGILILRLRIDRRSIAGLGLPGLKRSALWFALGSGIIIGPFLSLLILNSIFGWATMTLNTSSAALSGLAAAVVTAFFFEALPEELAFRGYIYRNLSAKYQRWAAMLMTAGLFVLLPSLLVQVQRYVLGMEVSIGGADSLQIGYLITMAFFGLFTNYLRILSGTVWMSTGFHLFFLQMSRIFGMNDSALIKLSDITSETPMQITLIVGILLIFAALIAYPFIVKRPLGLRKTDPEEA